MLEPPIGELIEKAGTRFALVLLAARRAREINNYFNQLGEGFGSYVPPQIHSLSRKPISVAFEEIAADKVVQGDTNDGEVVPSEDETVRGEMEV